MSEENSELVRKKNTIKRLFKNWENIILEGNRQQELNKWLDTPEISECTKRLNILSLKREKDFLANPDKYMTSYDRAIARNLIFAHRFKIVIAYFIFLDGICYEDFITY